MNLQTKTGHLNLLDAAVQLAQAKGNLEAARNVQRTALERWATDGDDIRKYGEVVMHTDGDVEVAQAAYDRAEADALIAWKGTHGPNLTREQYEAVLKLGEQFLATVTDWDF
jgi:hypothetical protein